MKIRGERAGMDAVEADPRPEGSETEPSADEADADESTPSPRDRFVTTTTDLVVLGFMLVGTVAPPDPFTQLFVFVPTLILSPAIGYWLVYRNGYERAGASLPSTRRVLATVFAGAVAVEGLRSLVRGAGLPIDAGRFTGAVVFVIAVWIAFFEGDGWLRRVANS